ncbi:nodulation protein NfeD [Corallococcus sp. H22C18031201]|nr:nodulation protein NfeD [Corallococcus sp. H22C18031201]
MSLFRHGGRSPPSSLRGGALLVLGLLGLVLLAPSAPRAQPEARAAPPVVRCDWEGVVDTEAGAYLSDCVKRAESLSATALLVRLDTPGGELDSTRDIVRAFLESNVPVLVWVGPAGARASSAGLFITLASQVAGMAPGTRVGAAHPLVGPTGEDPEQVAGTQLARKLENDAAAFASGLARERGRNAAWAASAVRDSASLPADRAVAQRVVEFESPTVAAFLAQVDGLSMRVASGDTVRLATRDARVITLSPGLSRQVVHVLAHPVAIYLLFLVAALGLVAELSHPGSFAPGIAGVVALVLALMAASALPVRAGALALMFAGLGLLVAELFVTSGLLGASGAVLLALGGLLLVDRVAPGWFLDPSFRVSWAVAIPSAVVLAAGAVFLAFRGAQTRRLPQRAGDAGLVGERGTTLAPVSPDGGEVFVHGERWRAISSEPLRTGTRVVVRAVQGLTLTVAEAPS